MARRQPDQLLALADKEGAGADHDASDLLRHQGGVRRLDVARVAGARHHELQPARLGGRLHLRHRCGAGGS